MRSRRSPAALIIALLFSACAHAGGTSSSAPAVAEPDVYLAPVVARMEIPWPKNRTVNVVFHGHSVPSGYFKTPIVDTFNAYPMLVHQGLKERFPVAVINVIVTAIGGENSETGAARFEHDVLSHHPDVLTIDYALNDRALGLTRAKAAWTRMIVKAKSKGIKVILLTPTPDLKSKLDDPADPLNQHAEQIRELAKTHGVALADSLAAFKKRTAEVDLASLMAQANHPNRKGHDIVAAEILRWFPRAGGP